MIVAQMFHQFQIRSLGPSVAATLIFETIIRLDTFCMTFNDSSLSLFNKTWNLIDVKLYKPRLFLKTF
jgi:hypothetical protein